MNHTTSVLSKAAHPSTAESDGGKGAANQERSRKNPAGTAATPFFGRAELGASRDSLQLQRRGLRHFHNPSKLSRKSGSRKSSGSGSSGQDFSFIL